MISDLRRQEPISIPKVLDTTSSYLAQAIVVHRLTLACSCICLFMGDVLLPGLRDFIHLSLHLWDLSGNTACPKCPDCVCAACEPFIQERVPEALTAALSFAQSQCSGSTSTTTALPSSCWSFSLFWIGFCVGAVVAGTFLVSLACCLRCCRSANSHSVHPSISGTTRQLTLSDGEPANPKTLKQLGFLR